MIGNILSNRVVPALTAEVPDIVQGAIQGLQMGLNQVRPIPPPIGRFENVQSLGEYSERARKMMMEQGLEMSESDIIKEVINL